MIARMEHEGRDLHQRIKDAMKVCIRGPPHVKMRDGVCNDVQCGTCGIVETLILLQWWIYVIDMDASSGSVAKLCLLGSGASVPPCNLSHPSRGLMQIVGMPNLGGNPTIFIPEPAKCNIGIVQYQRRQCPMLWGFRNAVQSNNAEQRDTYQKPRFDLPESTKADICALCAVRDVHVVQRAAWFRSLAYMHAHVCKYEYASIPPRLVQCIVCDALSFSCEYHQV